MCMCVYAPVSIHTCVCVGLVSPILYAIRTTTFGGFHSVLPLLSNTFLSAFNVTHPSGLFVGVFVAIFSQPLSLLVV